MVYITFKDEEDTEGHWITYRCEKKEGAFAFPPIQGTHTMCYEAILKNNKVVPAEGLDLAILAEGAYAKGTTRLRERVRKECFSEGVSAPARALWIPHKNNLAGVLVERDLEGRGLTNKMTIPENINGWKKGDNGIYVSPDKNKIFVPEESYIVGCLAPSEFTEDGFATAILTAEGAKMVARTAFSAGLIPWIRGFDVRRIDTPIQKVVGLYEVGGRLFLCGDWNGVNYGFAFGVRKAGEARAA